MSEADRVERRRRRRRQSERFMCTDICVSVSSHPSCMFMFPLSSLAFSLTRVYADIARFIGICACVCVCVCVCRKRNTHQYIGNSPRPNSHISRAFSTATMSTHKNHQTASKCVQKHITPSHTRLPPAIVDCTSV